jgi:hypothetical protein
MLSADKVAITAARLLLPTKRRVPLADLRWQAERVIEARRREHPELERQPRRRSWQCGRAGTMTLQRRLRAEQKLCRKARAERNATRGRHPEWSGCRLCF